MSIDLDRVRRDTPAAADLIHFNNAGASLPPTPVVETQIAHLRREAEIGGYEAAEEARERREGVYDSVARLLNCDWSEVALVENATVAWDMAFYALSFAPGDRILTAEAEYASNYIAFLQVARKTGAVVETVPSEATGELSVDSLERMIDGRVKLIAVTHVPTNGGLVNPAEEIGRVARAHGIPFLLDACQAAGQLPLDVGRLGCDMLSATGRKYLRGPRGTGFLYVRKEILDRLEPPFLDLRAATWVSPDRYLMRGDARRFENWENNIAALLGLGVAVDYALALGIDAIEERVTALAADLRARLADIAGVTVTDIGRRRCGIVGFAVAGHKAVDVVQALRARRINCSISTPSSTLLDATARKLPDVVRASVHYYNSEDEVVRFAAAVAEIARR
jgi:selenocysteine lyase/cysteine desulfurase